MKKVHDDDFPLSADPEENLRMENQFLELKLKAEFGVETFLEGDLPAEIENEVLKNVLEIENSFSQAQETKIRHLLGNPQIKPEVELNGLEVELFLAQITQMLLLKNIIVEFTGNYDNRTKYKFITEEILEEHILDTGIPDMMIHFIYEEFHPDHKLDLENKTKKFLSAWFEKDTDKLLWELADQIILPKGAILGKDEVNEKLQNVFNCYLRFSECTHIITGISFEIIDDTGMAYAEGMVSYNAIMANQEAIAIQGSFKLYFCLEYGWWDIYYFVLPGFEFTGAN